MLTADPTLYREARRVKMISFEEASELAYFGAKVLHPSTLLPAVQKQIPISILNSHRPQAPGTVITQQAPRTRNIFKSIACKKNITIVNICSTRMLMAYGFSAGHLRGVRALPDAGGHGVHQRSQRVSDGG